MYQVYESSKIDFGKRVEKIRFWTTWKITFGGKVAVLTILPFNALGTMVLSTFLSMACLNKNYNVNNFQNIIVSIFLLVILFFDYLTSSCMSGHSELMQIVNYKLGHRIANGDGIRSQDP